MAIQSPFAGETQKPGFFTPEIKEKMDEESKKNVEKLAQDEKIAAEELIKQKERDRVDLEVKSLTGQIPSEFKSTTNESEPSRSPSQVEIPQTIPASTIRAVPNVMNSYDKEVAAAEAPFIDQESKLQEKIDLQEQELGKIREDQAKIKPQARDYFYNKSTANKVFSAIGLAMASLTPEGAKNALSIINNTIDRDLKNQELAYADKGKDLESGQSIYKAYMDKLQNVQASKLAAKNDILKKLGLQLQAQAQQITSAEGQKRLSIMQQQADSEIVKNTALMQKELAKQQTSGVSGYSQGSTDPAIIRELGERVAAKDSAIKGLDQLTGLIKEGAKNPLGQNYASAELLREKLAADLAKAMFGRSSDMELEISRGLIPEGSSWREGRAVKLIELLKNRLDTDVDSYAKANNFIKNTSGANRNYK